MPNTKPPFRYLNVLPIALLWLALSSVLSAETGPPKATESELAKASYTEEKSLKICRLHLLTRAHTQRTDLQ